MLILHHFDTACMERLYRAMLDILLILTLFATTFSVGSGQNEPIAHHVVHIGIDGLRPDCIELAPGGAPNLLSRFTSEGTSTLTLGRTVTRAVSAPGWSATLTSMPPELTGVKSNLWSPAWLDPADSTYPVTHLTPVMGNQSPFPVVFQVIEEQEPEVETAAFYSWDFFDYMTEEGYPGVVDHVVDCDGSYEYCDQNVTDSLVEYLPNVFRDAPKSYSFIYLGNVDDTGHFSLGGWCGSQYSDAVAAADLQVGEILDVIDSSGNDDVMVMLSTDHGGEGWIHGRNQDEDLIIPMFIKGPGIKQNYEFQYKVRNMDMVPTAVRVLGLKPSPWWEGTVMTEAFQDGIL